MYMFLFLFSFKGTFKFEIDGSNTWRANFIWNFEFLLLCHNKVPYTTQILPDISSSWIKKENQSYNF
mgnify:CR=1 FL=1